LILRLYLYWYLSTLLCPTPPGRSWFPFNSSREELVSFQLLPGGVYNIYN
jgi:hypothetical protein